MILDTPTKRRELLDRVKTVAIVGASENPARASYFVLRYLRTHGYEVWPVNPTHASVDGLKSYPTLAALVAEHGVPDVVDVFRRPDALPEIVEEVIAVGAKALWLQYGVVNDQAIKRADEAGLAVVVDRCMKAEHARFSGGLSMAGMDSGIVTSKRRAAARLS
ncbi:MAG: CoA-binding protein [Candidatus Eremiobacteraeota bacterium]|nr:CoA-binding protein [Candidatus Eremiobacteraeota bacterium]